ncbi:hypothetical protein [Clostridium akagii]|uniref:hypothetical protein n=1 Tax=Clostridium akagii TaxID=91623 RepID=UPI00047BFD57
MLAEKNKDIKKAYDLLQIISKDENARMLYESRQAEISDQLTRIKSAEEKGSNKRALRVEEKMLRSGDSIEDVVDLTELPREIIMDIKNKMNN